eukprot:scaffold47088_cov79-Phaeocystis_antarctica.AAC.2
MGHSCVCACSPIPAPQLCLLVTGGSSSEDCCTFCADDSQRHTAKITGMPVCPTVKIDRNKQNTD